MAVRGDEAALFAAGSEAPEQGPHGRTPATVPAALKRKSSIPA